MITSLNAATGIAVHNGTSVYPTIYNTTYITDNTINVGPVGTKIIYPGDVRYNALNYNLEIFDGCTWVTLPKTFPTIELTHDVMELLNYVRTLKANEISLKERAEKVPAIRDLLRQRQEIDDKIKMVEILTKEEVKT